MTRIITIIISISIFFCACRKEGCRDSAATNFDDGAKKDCDCCQYEGQVVFWWDKEASDAFIDFGSKSLVVTITTELGEETIGSAALTVFSPAAPACEQGGISGSKTWSDSKIKQVVYTVSDETGYVYFIDTVNLEANKCVTVQIKR